MPVFVLHEFDLSGVLSIVQGVNEVPLGCVCGGVRRRVS
jgi:hypothetical protein